MSHAWSHPRCASSSRIRINSGTAIVGCVSLSWMATFSGSVFQSALLRRKRRTRSASEQATRKYSCTKRSPCPMLVESSGYKTRVSDSAVSVSATAPTKSPLLNSLKIEIIRRRGGPEPKRVDGLAAVADHGAVEGDADQAGRSFRGSAARLPPRISNEQFSLTSTFSSGRTTSHGIRRGGASCPAVPAASRPGSSAEDAVFVTQTVAHGGKLHRGHRVEEARRQAPEPAVAKAGVGFRFKQAEPIEVLLLDPLPGEGVEQEVCDIVCQRAADEKLHRKVIDALGVLALIGLLGEQPALREDVPHGAGKGLEVFSRARGGQFDDVVEEQVPLVKRVSVPANSTGPHPYCSRRLAKPSGPVDARGAAFCFVLICRFLSTK